MKLEKLNNAEVNRTPILPKNEKLKQFLERIKSNNGVARPTNPKVEKLRELLEKSKFKKDEK